MAFRTLAALLCGLAVVSSAAVVPNHNLAGSSAERSASGNFFNQNFFARDDSKVRHLSTTLLSNAASKSDFSSALSQPLPALEPVIEHIYPFGETHVESFVPPIEKILIEPTIPVQETIIEPIVPIVEPVFPILEQLRPLPVLPAFEPTIPHYRLPVIEPALPYYGISAVESVISPFGVPAVETVVEVPTVETLVPRFPYFGIPTVETVISSVGIPALETLPPYFGVPAVETVVPYYGPNYFTAIDKVPVHEQFSPYAVTYGGLKI